MTRTREDAGALEVLSADQMQRWDRRSIEELGVLAAVLMENAARGAARVLHELYPDGRVVAFVGRGNNGGDAAVLLRTLASWGREVAAVPIGGAELPRTLLHGWELPIYADAAEALRGAAVVVDGVLGTGATGAPRGAAAEAVRLMNDSDRPVLALDGPTGVDMTSGAIPGEAVRAEVTVTFGAPKRGLLFFPGRSRAGRLVVLDIGLPPLEVTEPVARLITARWVEAHRPRRAANAHKGGSGTVAVLAGHPGMGGAAILVGMGALRSGAGKVRMVAPEANRIALQVTLPEALFVDRARDALGEVFETADAVVAGPGMGTDDEALSRLTLLLETAKGPILLDADAVTLVARNPGILQPEMADRVLITPHPGEMSRLMDAETRDVVADPLGVADAAAQRFGCTVLLKGSPSVVTAPGRDALLNVAGHSGIATSGMGDTLAGVIGAFLGGGAAPRAAAAAGLYVAGRAAELVGFDRPVLPRDVAEALPLALARPQDFGSLRHPDVRLDLPAAR